MDLDLLRRLDACLDAAPRTAARVETVGPFTVFVKQGAGWPYYARPTPGAAAFTTADVRAVRERQREIGVPEAFEWVEELAPDLAGAVEATGLEVTHCPLMVLEPEGFRPMPAPSGARIRIVAAGDDLAIAHAIAMVAFANAGTDAGPIGEEALDEIVAGLEPAFLTYVSERIARGTSVTALAEIDGRPAAVGSHNPVGDASEIVGVGTLPAFRRRGLGAALTSVLVEDARSRGISDVLLSAGGEAVARVYARIGFRVVGTAGAAQPPAGAAEPTAGTGP